MVLKMWSISHWPVDLRDIDFVYLPYAHIDHIGRLPELVQNGFGGEIICSHPTKALLEALLEDALGFTEYSYKQKQKIL